MHSNNFVVGDVQTDCFLKFEHTPGKVPSEKKANHTIDRS